MDSVGSEVHFAPNQPVGPQRINIEAMAEQADGSTIIGASKINQFAVRKRCFFSPVPPWRKAVASRSCLDTRSRAQTMGLDVATGSGLEIRKRVVVEAVPDFCLPAGIEALDGCLKASLQWRSKHRSHLKAQAEADDSTDGVGKLVGSLEKRVIVKLSEARQSKSAPVLGKSCHHGGGADCIHWPGDHQTPVQRDAIEHPDLSSTFDDEPFHNVEAVKLQTSRSDFWQVPTWRWWRAAHSLLSIQGPSALQDAADGAYRGRIGQPLCQPLALDGCGTELPQIALRAQLMAKAQYQIFPKSFRTTRMMGHARTIAPVNLIELTTLGASYPSPYGRKAHSKLSSDRPHRGSAVNSFYHGLSLRFPKAFLPMLGTPKMVFDHHNDTNVLASR